MTSSDTACDGGPEGTVPATPIQSFLADPSLLIADGRYYLYPTSDGHHDWLGTSFSVFSSTDLDTWTDHGVILRLGADVPWASEKAWAPAAVERDGRFYFYFTAAMNIGVATADSPTGPFTALGRPLVAEGTYGGTAIDPSIFIDDDGTYYLIWGNGVAHCVPLNDDMTSFDPAKVISWVPTDFREALTIHRDGGQYVASWSVNDTRDEDYHLRYASAPTLTGPWTDHGVLLAKDPARSLKGPGHHGIVRAPDGQWVLAYHRFAIPDGDGHHRVVAFSPLTHEDGIPVPVNPPDERFRHPL